MNDSAIFQTQGFGNSVGIGRRPAVVFVDITVGFNDPQLFGGGNIPGAVDSASELLVHARNLGLPIAHTRIIYHVDGSNVGVLATKVPSLATLTLSNPASGFVGSMAPIAGELEIHKTEPSAFFGTGFAAWLVNHRVDTLIVAGCTTSGCVRATVVDAVSHNFRTVVVEDCCGDRSVSAHNNSIFDMQQKYADVMRLPDLRLALETVRSE
ncbi:isochorismatase family protein [Paraburkholderia aspalathi]|uniref:isochorismatase family protein n=1 Tax=Paraburkholderia aspalathi TaxID=1324617 RepID=UPI0038BBEDB5